MSLNLKPGGTEGGDAWFLGAAGFLLSAFGLYFFFDSVHVRGGAGGLVSGWIGRRAGGGGDMGMMQTTSMGLIFVPFFIGVAWLFYDSKKTPGWILMWGGLGMILIEILSRIRFEFSMKTTHLLLVLVMVAAGVGMMVRSYREDIQEQRAKEKERQDSA